MKFIFCPLQYFFGYIFLLVLIASASCADKGPLFAVIVVQSKPVATFFVRAYSPVSHFLLLACDPGRKLGRYDMLAL
jgi:hypothetical protein